MSTAAQARAYQQVDDETQGAMVERIVLENYLCTIDDVKALTKLPKSTITARLNPRLKSGVIGEYHPNQGNTQYFVTQTPEEANREAYKYKTRNHPITKLWKRLQKEGSGTQAVYAHLMATYDAMEGTNHSTVMSERAALL